MKNYEKLNKGQYLPPVDRHPAHHILLATLPHQNGHMKTFSHHLIIPKNTLCSQIENNERKRPKTNFYQTKDAKCNAKFHDVTNST